MREDGEEAELGAGGGEEMSGVQGVFDGNSCGELGKERVYAGVVGAAGVGSEATMWEEVESAEGA
jgi:hypothetical protein